MATGAQAPHVAVIILTMNQRAKTLRCLSSLRAVTEPRHTVVLWDNGSEDGTAEAVRAAFPEVLLHCHGANLGVAGGRNAAAALAIESLDPTHLMFLDNDTVVTPDFLDPLLHPFASDDGIGQTHPKIRMLDEPDRIDCAGTETRFWLAQVYGIGHGEIDAGQYDRTRLCLAGGCSLVPARLFQELGGFDTRFNPYGPEDIDFSLRVGRAGYRTLMVPQSLIFHEGSRTPFHSRYSESYVRLKARHWVRFMHTHASPGEWLALALLGLPYLAARAVVREGRRGNLRALRGVFGGLVDLWRSRAPTD